MRKILVFFFTSIVTVLILVFTFNNDLVSTHIGLLFEQIGGAALITLPIILIYGVPASVISDVITSGLTGVMRLLSSFLVHSFFGLVFAFLFVAIFDFRLLNFNDTIDRTIFLFSSFASIVFWFFDEIIKHRYRDY